ncbi:amyloid-beta A4 precursor protein-binding family A member 1-like [Conger conger]|uniref:amyloid-beta A4 precursor protein-binding family A member 1-like n=1 Tax=Conger conger TaxID=82655 RepID=UPI002A5AA205|nr:amyloid-beta A4 precursor protein-binding family A member 1-like [Conger conger]
MPAPVPPPHSPDHNHAALNPKLTKSRRTHHQQPRQQRTEPATDPNAAEPNVEPTTAPHVKPNIEPCAESSKEPSTESYSCTERNTEPHKESHTEPDTGSCTESYRDPHLESHTDAHGQLGQGYEEIEGEWEGEWVRQTALQLRRAGLRLFEQGGLWQRRTVGSRLHHYDGRSDGESDSPEKEPEVLLSPGQKDGEKVEAAYVRRRRSWSLDRALGEVGDWPESEQDSQREQGQDEAQEEVFQRQLQPGQPQDGQASQGEIGPGKPEDGQAFQRQLQPGQPQEEEAFQRPLQPGQPQEEKASQGEIGPGQHQDGQSSQGKIGPGQPQDEQASQGDIGPGQPQEEQSSQGEIGPGQPQEEQSSQGEIGPGQPQKEQSSQGEIGPGQPQEEQSSLGEIGPGQPQEEQNSPREPQDEYGAGEQNWGRRDSLSLAIKDIKEAIQEVKTRTIRSPYTPEEPMQPVWVMRQDLSPTTESDLQPSLGSVSSLDSDSTSPLGPESTNRQQLQETNYSVESPPSQEPRKTLASFPTYVDVPGPCDPEDLIDGIIFAANYLGSTQLLSEKTPSKSVRMTQAQEAVSRVRMAKSRKKSPQSPEAQPPVSAEVDLFISTQRIKVLNADTQETMMDHPLRTISYIADIGDIVVLMARRKRPRPRSQELPEAGDSAHEGRSQYSDLTHDERGQCSDSAQEGRSQYSNPTQEGRGQYNDPTHEGRDQYLDSAYEGRGQGSDSAYEGRGHGSDSGPEGRGQGSDSAPEGRGQGSDSAPEGRRQYRMICHVFESEDAQLIAQSIGQAFSVAYQEFLRANGINPEDLSQREYSDLLSTQDMYNDDLIHFSKSENCKNVVIEKQKGEILGVVVVESGWGSILPTVIIANMMHGGPAERSGGLSVGDQVMSINNTSLVGLPLTTCQSIIKGLKSQPRLKLNIVRCPPVTMVLIRRPDLRYQLGFSVQNGIICSLMRGGIAERGGVRVGHRIIEISGQSVVATPHERIVNILSSAVGEIHMKTMPAAMYRLLTGQEQPVYI